MDGALQRAITRHDSAERDLVTARNNLGKPFARADELAAARERVASLEHQLTRDKTPTHNDATASHDNRATTTGTQEQDALSPQLATARTNNNAALEEDWDEWEGWDEPVPAQPRTQQQINAEGSQRVRDILAARRNAVVDDGRSAPIRQVGDSGPIR